MQEKEQVCGEAIKWSLEMPVRFSTGNIQETTREMELKHTVGSLELDLEKRRHRGKETYGSTDRGLEEWDREQKGASKILEVISNIISHAWCL